MGIIPLFDWGEANLIFMGKFILINIARSRIKVFEPFDDSSKNHSTINAILISHGCVLKWSSKPVIQGSRVESIQEARKEYKKLLEEGWGKTYRFTIFFKKQWWIGTLPKNWHY